MAEKKLLLGDEAIALGAIWFDSRHPLHYKGGSRNGFRLFSYAHTYGALTVQYRPSMGVA